MIRHVFTMKFKPDANEEQINAFITEMKTLKGQIPGMIDFHIGRNLAWHMEKSHTVVVADLEDRKAWDTYMNFPKHLALGEKYADLFDEPTMIASQIEID